MGRFKDNRPQLVFFFVLSSVLTHVLGQVQPSSAANPSSSETASSSQPLWSYQVKPNSYVNAQNPQSAPYVSGVPSLFDAFNGLSQRQGALSGSPFLSILPIILIAAGGMLLLLPILTMMMASPFSGSFGGYNSAFGYPQMGLNKKRSLNESFNQKGLLDLIEHVSSSIEEITKKYSPTQSNSNQAMQGNKRAKSLNPQQANELTQNNQPANHRPTIAGGSVEELNSSNGGAAGNKQSGTM